MHALLKATKAVGLVVVLLKRLLNTDQLLGALLPFSLSLSPSLSPPQLPPPPFFKNGLCLQGPHHLPADIQDMIDEWPRALSRLCQLLIIYTSYLCQ